MNTASFTLCRKLYELSGWELPAYTGYSWIEEKLFINLTRWHDTMGAGHDWIRPLDNGPERDATKCIPAYDLGYLLRKLPSEFSDSDGNVYRLRGGKNQYYFFEYQSREDYDVRWWNISPFSKGSPEEAVCELAIELFKQEVLKSA